MPAKKASAKKTVKKGAKKALRKVAKPACVCAEACKPEESFWVNYGPVVDSIAALRAAITAMSDEQYRYHTAEGRNDFASWIRDCFHQDAVADRVAKAKTKAGAVKALKACCA